MSNKKNKTLCARIVHDWLNSHFLRNIIHLAYHHGSLSLFVCLPFPCLLLLCFCGLSDGWGVIWPWSYLSGDTWSSSTPFGSIPFTCVLQFTCVCIYCHRLLIHSVNATSIACHSVLEEGFLPCCSSEFSSILFPLKIFAFFKNSFWKGSLSKLRVLSTEGIVYRTDYKTPWGKL